MYSQSAFASIISYTVKYSNKYRKRLEIKTSLKQLCLVFWERSILRAVVSRNYWRTTSFVGGNCRRQELTRELVTCYYLPPTTDIEVLFLVACVNHFVTMFVICNLALQLSLSLWNFQNRYCDHATTFAMWQHPAMKRGAKFAAPGFTCYLPVLPSGEYTCL